MTIFLTILTICGITASLVALFLSWRWSAALAWVSLLPMYFLEAHPVSGSVLTFWAIACAIAICINTLLPTEVSSSRVGVPYMTTGALAGAFTGMLLSNAGMIIGTVAGAALGSIAFCKTPAGKNRGIAFPWVKWLNYTCAKGFPIIATVCTDAVGIMATVSMYTIS